MQKFMIRKERGVSYGVANRTWFVRWTTFLLVCAVLLCLWPCRETCADTEPWPVAPDVSAEGAILIEASTGTVLYEKNSSKALYPASTTKLMTALLALENSAMGEVVTVSKDAVYGIPTDSSRIWVDVGEQLTMEESLYALMLPSANDLAYAISEHISGTMPAFAERMNARAAELGCVNSHFVNPHGYDEEGHHSCAADLATIMRELVKYPAFLKISGSKNHKIPATNLCAEDRWVLNTHLMIRGTKPYDGILAGKTGHTDLAGANLVTVAKRGNLTLIVALMKASDDEKLYAETAALLDYGFANFNTYSMSGEPLTDDYTIPPLFTKDDAVKSIAGNPIITVESGSIVLPSTSSLSDVKKTVTLTQLTTFQSGKNRVGKITYTYGTHTVGSADLIYENEGAAFTLGDPTLSPSTHPDASGGSKNPTATPDDVTTPSQTGDPSTKKEDAGKPDRRPLIIAITLGCVCFFVGIYLVFVEIPYRKRKKDYLDRKRRRRR